MLLWWRQSYGEAFTEIAPNVLAHNLTWLMNITGIKPPMAGVTV